MLSIGLQSGVGVGGAAPVMNLMLSTEKSKALPVVSLLSHCIPKVWVGSKATGGAQLGWFIQENQIVTDCQEVVRGTVMP